MSAPTREFLVCAAALLDQGRIVDRLSRLLTAAALIGMLVGSTLMAQPPWMLIVFAALVALFGFTECYFAIRVAFDAALLHRIASASEPDFTGIDAALARLGLLPPEKRGRPVEARVAGARRLFRSQLVALAAQVLVVIGASLARVWR
jgi:hypothetical protein